MCSSDYLLGGVQCVRATAYYEACNVFERLPTTRRVLCSSDCLLGGVIDL